MTDRKLVKQIIRKFKDIDENTDVVFRQPNTYVRIYYSPHGEATVYGHGFSKVCWPDQWNSQRGYEIALAKAAQDVVLQLASTERGDALDDALDALVEDQVYDDMPFRR